MDPPPLAPSAQPLSSTMAPTSSAAPNGAAIQPNYPDSVESSPRSRIADTWNDEPLPPVPGAKLRLMCSYGGHIMPRPHDKSLCYVGGDTRIVVVDRNSTLKDLCLRLSGTLLNGRPFTLKYQLPNEDLDNLITVTTDEDLDNMIEEYDRVAASSSTSSSSASPLKPSPSRLRVFLFFSKPESSVSMGSLLDDAKSETWFVDALNNSGILTRGVSDSAAGDSFVNLDGVSVGVGGGGSSNNLEAQGLADNTNSGNNKVKNLQEIVTANSLPESPSSSPSMANLPPIRVRVEENVGSRLQQEQRIGVMEDQFAQMTIGATGVGGGVVVRQDDGYVVVPSAVAMPAIPAQPVTMASSATMVSTNNVENMNRVVSDDERSDLGYRKPPLPLQLVQPRTSAGISLPSPDSVASDSSSITSTNSFSKNVYYQEQVQPSHVDNKPQALNNTRTELPDQMATLQREQIQESGYTIPQQLDQNQQLQQQQQQQQQFVHANTHYIHHPTAPTATVPVSSYYQVYAPQSQPQLHHPQISQQQYPVYVMPVGHTQPYNVTLQPNISDPNVVAASSGRTIVPQSVAPPTTGTPPIYPPRQNTPTTIPDLNVNVNPTSAYQPPMASNPAFVQIPSNQFQQQYVGLPPQVHHHHPAQQIAVATPGGTNAYGYEYGGGNVQDQQGYYTHQTSTVPLASQYQSMTPAAAAAALSDASRQFPNNDNIQQPNRTSQPV